MKEENQSLDGFMGGLPTGSKLGDSSNTMSKGLEQSSDISKIAEALAKAQGNIEGAIANSKGHYNHSYADLHSVIESCRKHLSHEGIAFVLGFTYDTTLILVDKLHLIVTGGLYHKSGQWIKSQILLPLDKKDLQGMGSASTYGRRYLLSALVGVAQFDDDGQSAITHHKTEAEQDEFNELIKHKAFDRRRNTTVDWWENKMITKSQVHTGLTHMRNEIELVDKRTEDSELKKEVKKAKKSVNNKMEVTA